MENVIGEILKGTIAGEDATFEVVSVKHDEITNENYAIAECVEFGAPHQIVNMKDINKAVRA